MVVSSTESYVQYHLHLLGFCVRGLISIGLSRLFISLLRQYVATLNIWFVFFFFFWIFLMGPCNLTWFFSFLYPTLLSWPVAWAWHQPNCSSTVQETSLLPSLVRLNTYWVCNVPDIALGTKFYMWRNWKFLNRI